ncbi:MAG: SLBB domain-containing protein [Psychrobium sp.]|nr:SLBB domain-containing protein [Psychrobium sp.]
MLAQFKNMPKAEQQRLMKQYGLSPQMLQGKGAGKAVEIATPALISEREAFREIKILEQANKAAAPVKAKGLKSYGYDMFAGEPSTFAPVSDIPIPTEYLMGPGDVVNIQIYGKDNQQYSLTVARNGNLQMPDMGPIGVLGLTFDQLKDDLTKRIKEQYIGVASSISLGELRSIRIIVAGEAYKPGSYTVSSLSTVTQALFVSGGISGIGSLRNIQVKRRGKTIARFDLYDLLMKGDASGDVRLQSGDVVFIPPVGATVGIKGEVRRPAIYELKDNENVAQLVKLAAGLKSNSYPKASVLQTFDKNYLPSLVNINLTTKQGRQYRLKDGDVLNVKSTTNTVKNQIVLAGAVNRPGLYQWQKGMRVSDLVQSRWSDLKGSVDLQYSLISREINMQGDIQVLQFSLANIFENINSKDNIKLSPRDTIIVFSQTSSRRNLLSTIIRKLKNQASNNGITNIAMISGEVRFPGEYPITGTGKISDIIEAAGGLKDSAYKGRAELTRLLVTRDSVASVIHTNINLQGALDNNATDNVVVSSKDQLHILKIPDWQEQLTVTINGEVMFPGAYSVRKGETLSSVIERAGGYTKEAFLDGAVFTRESVKRKERQQISKLSDQMRLDLASKGLTDASNTISFAEASLILKELENLTVVGRMILALDEARCADLTIENGDMLFIPIAQQTITVVGEVQHASTHFFKKNLSLEQYIKLAGGSRQRADDERIYVIRANGAVMISQSGLWFNSTVSMQPGDTVVVPLNTEYKDNITLWSQVTQIIYNTAVAFAAVKGL